MCIFYSSVDEDVYSERKSNGRILERHEISPERRCVKTAMETMNKRIAADKTRNFDVRVEDPCRISAKQELLKLARAWISLCDTGAPRQAERYTRLQLWSGRDGGGGRGGHVIAASLSKSEL